VSPNKINRPPSCCTQLLPFCRRGSRWTPTGTIANTEDAMPSPDARVWLRGIANCAHSPGPSFGCLATATLGYLFTRECPAVEESPQILTRATRTHSSFGNPLKTTRKPLRPAPDRVGVASRMAPGIGSLWHWGGSAMHPGSPPDCFGDSDLRAATQWHRRTRENNQRMFHTDA
jgi:hypothetical protein